MSSDTPTLVREEGLISEFGNLTLDGVRQLLHDGCENYLDEVYLFRYLGERLSAEGWSSTAKGIRYTHLSGYPDLRTSSPDGSVVITTEGKYFVLDWPTRVAEGTVWDGSIARQHLGVFPGKANNAVHDVTVKLAGVTSGTHVAFLLVRFALASVPGDTDVQQMVRLSGLDHPQWVHFSSDWLHPRNDLHHVWVTLWVRRRATS